MDMKELRDRIVEDPEVPEMVREFLRLGADLVEIRLDAHGNWWHGGDTFQNEKLIRLFHRSLHRTSAGNWVLHIKPYTYPVVVEQGGTFVERLSIHESGRLVARLLTGEEATLDTSRVYTDGEELIATLVDGVPARLVSTAYRQITSNIAQDEDTWILRFGDHVIRTIALPTGFFAISA